MYLEYEESRRGMDDETNAIKRRNSKIDRNGIKKLNRLIR